MEYCLPITKALVLRNAALLIATCLCTEGANAARTLTLTFEATGTGERISGFNTNGTPNIAPLESARVSYVVTEQTGNPNVFYFPFTTFFTFSNTGLSFAAGAGPTLGFYGSGRACYANDGIVAGTYAIDPACSTLSYRDVRVGGFSETFTGNLTRFTIAEGNTLASGFTFEKVSVIPEASTWLMMLVGFVALGGVMRYQRRNTRVAFV